MPSFEITFGTAVNGPLAFLPRLLVGSRHQSPMPHGVTCMPEVRSRDAAL